VLGIAAVLTPLPFLGNLASFRQLIWFGDELHLVLGAQPTRVLTVWCAGGASDGVTSPPLPSCRIGPSRSGRAISTHAAGS